jgi:hypothetical protein
MRASPTSAPKRCRSAKPCPGSTVVSAMALARIHSKITTMRSVPSCSAAISVPPSPFPTEEARKVFRVRPSGRSMRAAAAYASAPRPVNLSLLFLSTSYVAGRQPSAEHVGSAPAWLGRRGRRARRGSREKARHRHHVPPEHMRKGATATRRQADKKLAPRQKSAPVAWFPRKQGVAASRFRTAPAAASAGGSCLCRAGSRNRRRWRRAEVTGQGASARFVAIEWRLTRSS